MTETTSTDIYDYLTDFKCPLHVKVIDNNGIVNEGNATKTPSMNGFYIGENFTNIYLTDITNQYLTFYADYPKFTLTDAIRGCNISGGGSKKKKRKSRRVSNKKRKATRKYR